MRAISRTKAIVIRQGVFSLLLLFALPFLRAPLHGQVWQKVVIDSEVETPCDVRIVDLDGDGDQDIVASDWRPNFLLWYENTGNNVTWKRHCIAKNIGSVMGVAVADFDGDAKPDIAIAVWTDKGQVVSGYVTWYRNNLPDSNWVNSDIDPTRFQASWVEAGDVDNDGDIDVLSSSNDNDKLVLHYNRGGIPTSWVNRPINQSQGNDGAQMVLIDMNEDGMLDIVSAIKNNNRLIWLEQSQRFPYWTEQCIDSLLPSPRNPEVGDFDYDGDLDIVVGGDTGKAVVRYEQVGRESMEWMKSIVDSKLRPPGHVGMLEIDGGAEKEVVATSRDDAFVTWYRHVGESWYRHYIDDDLEGARKFRTADIDGDGNDELIVTAQEKPGGGEGILVYYRNLSRVPRISCTPKALDFGLLWPDSSAALTLTLTNTGIGLLTIDPIEIMGSGAASFRLDSAGTIRLQPGQSVVRTITCTPTATGVVKASLRIRSNDPIVSEQQLNLVAECVTRSIPHISVAPASLDFGNVVVKNTVERTLEIWNSGTDILFVDRLEFSGTSSGFFRIDNEGPFTLFPGARLPLKVRCVPMVTGIAEEVLHIRSNDPSAPDVYVNLIVDGVTGLPSQISCDRTELDFGKVLIGSTVQRTLMVQNTGQGKLIVDTLEVVGPSTTPFHLNGQVRPSLQPGESTSVTISCNPTAEGVQHDLLHMQCNDPSSPYTYVHLLVQGVEDSLPRISCCPMELDFGDVEVGDTVTRTLMTINTGLGRLAVDSMIILGASASPFHVPASCPDDIASGDTVCTMISCTPIQMGKTTRRLQIHSNDPTRYKPLITLRVNGISDSSPRISVDPVSFDFGSVPLFSSVQRTLVITNIGGAPLVIVSMQILGTGMHPFTLGHTGTFTLQPGDTARVEIRCTPTIKGSTQRQLHIACNDPSCPSVDVMLAVEGSRTDIADAPVSPALRMDPNYPNPFNPSTVIKFTLPADGAVRLIVLDLLGREVARLVDGNRAAGRHHVAFNGADLPSGVYICRVEWDNQVVTRRMTLMK